MRSNGNTYRALLVIGFSLCVAVGAAAGDLGTLQATVTDSASGLPMPCTVTLTDAAGKIIIENQSFTHGFRCDGRFEKQIAAGPARVRVTRGFEFRAVERTIEIPAGGMTNVTIPMSRVVDLRRR